MAAAIHIDLRLANGCEMRCTCISKSRHTYDFPLVVKSRVFNSHRQQSVTLAMEQLRSLFPPKPVLTEENLPDQTGKVHCTGTCFCHH